MNKFIPQGMGWIPELPDPRDYTHRHKEIFPLLQQLKPYTGPLPDEVDLTYGDEGEVFFTAVEDQGLLNSSTAFAVLSLVEYSERRMYGRTFDGSKLFLYKVARNLRDKGGGSVADNGVDIRTTFKALRLFGVPDAEHWPYAPAIFHEEPNAFTYQASRRFSHLRYFRLDRPNQISSNCTNRANWNLVASFLAAGFPLAFGFSIPSSISDAADIPYRPHLDRILGGQTVLAIGYRMHHYGRNQPALRIRTSWGTHWGSNGNGWLPLSFINSCHGSGFWTLISESWLPTSELSRPQETSW